MGVGHRWVWSTLDSSWSCRRAADLCPHNNSADSIHTQRVYVHTLPKVTGLSHNFGDVKPPFPPFHETIS